MGNTKRKVIDCRELPGEDGCTLRIAGTEKEVLIVAVKHAIDEHGHKNTSELRKQIKELLKDE
jgi:predicted small metal-binding protein